MAERRVHPNCVYKSNPYHECVESCFEKMAQGKIDSPKKKSGPGSFILIIPKKLSFKKKSSLKSLDAEPDIIKPPVVHPKSPSKEIRAQQQPKIVQTESRLSEGQDSNNEQEMVKNDTIMSSGRSSDQAGSMADPRVPVGKYRVNDNAAKILMSIFGKYGDIAENCKLESAAMRSHYLECLCSVVDDLQRKSPNRLSESKLREMLAVIKDVESVGISIQWLSPVTDGVKEVIKLIRQRKTVEAKKRESEATTESLRKVLELRLDDVAELEKAVSVAKAKVDETRDHLAALERESFRLGETIESIEAKVNSVDCKTMVKEMLC